MAQVALQVTAGGSLNSESQVEVASLLLPQAVAATLTTEPTGVDLQGADAATLVIHAGLLTDGEYTIVLEHSDDDGVGDAYAPIAAALYTLIGDASDIPVLTVANDNQVHQRSIRAATLKRWVNITVTETSAGATGIVLSAEVVRAHKHYQPDQATAA